MEDNATLTTLLVTVLLLAMLLLTALLQPTPLPTESPCQLFHSSLLPKQSRFLTFPRLNSEAKISSVGKSEFILSWICMELLLRWNNLSLRPMILNNLSHGLMPIRYAVTLSLILYLMNCSMFTVLIRKQRIYRSQ